MLIPTSIILAIEAATSTATAARFLCNFDDLFQASTKLFDDHGLVFDLAEAFTFGLFGLGEQTLASGLHDLRRHKTKGLPGIVTMEINFEVANFDLGMIISVIVWLKHKVAQNVGESVKS